ncbi:MAG: hypothetical protein K1X53_01795 [Candidatus Sumerlaeaceae bacterium]|nr:hypothetical protein [Candidatus Sumerlaeaceae bacterium]
MTNRPYHRIAASCLTLLALLAFAPIAHGQDATTATKVAAEVSSSTKTTTGSNYEKLYADRCALFEKENAQIWNQPGADRPVVLLGSSSMHIIKPDQMFPGYKIANRGISSDRIRFGTRGVLGRMQNSVYDCHPRAVFVLIGTNDLGAVSKSGKPTFDEVVADYAELIGKIRKGVPDAEVFIVSNHATRDKSAHIAPFIKPFNEANRKLAEAGDKKIHFVDYYTETVGPDGLLKPELTKDGLHLNAEGYKFLQKRFIEAMDSVGIKPTATAATTAGK